MRKGTVNNAVPFWFSLFVGGEGKGAVDLILIIGVAVNNIDGINGGLQILEVTEAVLRSNSCFFLRDLLIIFLLVDADDNSLLLFIDIDVLAVVLLVLLGDLLLDILGKRVVVARLIGIILLTAELIDGVAASIAAARMMANNRFMIIPP